MEELQQTVSKIEKLTTLNLRFGGKDKKLKTLSFLFNSVLEKELYQTKDLKN